MLLAVVLSCTCHLISANRGRLGPRSPSICSYFFPEILLKYRLGCSKPNHMFGSHIDFEEKNKQCSSMASVTYVDCGGYTICWYFVRCLRSPSTATAATTDGQGFGSAPCDSNSLVSENVGSCWENPWENPDTKPTLWIPLVMT